MIINLHFGNARIDNPLSDMVQEKEKDALWRPRKNDCPQMSVPWSNGVYIEIRYS